MPDTRSWLQRLALDRPELRAWAIYDWANSAFQTTVITAVFPLFFSGYAAADLPKNVATARFAAATTLAMIVIAVLGPVLGALADVRAAKKKLLAAFLALGIVTCLLFVTIDPGEWRWAALLFIVSNIGLNGSFVFYDSLLPHIARPDEIDRVSTAGYAIGYIGGGVLLALNLWWIQRPDMWGLPDRTMAIKLSFVSVAVWWLVFSIPLFRHVPEPAAMLERGETPEHALVAAFRRLGGTFRELRGYRHAFLMLLAFLLYNDGIQTIIKMATVYGAEIGIDTGAQIAAIMLVQFVGVPFAFLFGRFAEAIGAKRAILVGLAVYTGISLLGYFMRTELQFFVLAILVGMVQGGTQALSRSVFARMIPKHKSSEYFGFFSVFEKFAGIFGPAAFALAITLTGSSRDAILSVIVFFVLGALVLLKVDVAEGERAAGLAEPARKAGV